jgi:hypothetical protein
MDDLKERFAEADLMVGRDHWRDIANRAVSPEATPRPFGWPPALRRRAVAAVVASAVFVASSVFAWNLSHPEIVPEPPSPADPPVDLAAGLAPGWTELPSPPEMRDRAATAWTGSELIVWGGYVYEVGFGEGPLSHEGSVFDAASRRWEPMAAGPLSARSAAASAWTGEEFLVWGGRSRETCCRPSDTELFLNDGAAYDPATRTWRRLPDAPIEARAPLSVWTGEEMIVWGSRDRFVRHRDGAAYDPRSNTWRRIADGPIELTDAVAVWSGEEMFVFGAALHGGNVPETETAIGAAYDPATDSWRRLPPSLDSNPNANTAVWADERLIALDYDSDAETYEPSTGRWRMLEPMPLDDGEDIPDAAYIEGWVLARFFRGVAGFSTDAERWFDLTDDLAEEAPRTLIFGPPIPAGSAFLAFAIGPGERSRLLAYRPPSIEEIEPSPFVPESVVEGGVARVALTFPDGATATLVYPEALQLARFGVQPDNTYTSGDNSSVGGGTGLVPIVFIHGPIGVEHDYVSGSEPVRRIEGVGGELLELWEAIPLGASSVAADHWLLHRVGDWTVLVGIAEPIEAHDVARSLIVHVASTGMPWVEARNGFELSPFAGELGGTNLTIGDIEPAPNLISFEDPGFPFIEIHFFECRDGSRDVSADGEHATLCTGGGHVVVTLSGERNRVQPLLDGIRIADFRPA